MIFLSGKISEDYNLPVASSSRLGGVRVGSNLSINSSGVLSAKSYTLPTASSTTLGGVKVGSGLSINNGVLSSSSTGGISLIDSGSVTRNSTIALSKSCIYVIAYGTYVSNRDNRPAIILPGMDSVPVQLGDSQWDGTHWIYGSLHEDGTSLNISGDFRNSNNSPVYWYAFG